MRVLLVSEGKHESGGAAEALVRRLNGRIVEIEHDRSSRATLRAVFGKGRGYYKRAVRWIIEARKRGFDAVVLIADHDGRDERLKELARAQDYKSVTFPRALGVAIRTFDAWMLADETALSKTLGMVVQRQPDPEDIVDPKRRCEELLGESPNRLTQTQMYSTVAGHADLEVMQTRCPKGFLPFAERVRKLTAE